MTLIGSEPSGDNININIIWNNNNISGRIMYGVRISVNSIILVTKFIITINTYLSSMQCEFKTSPIKIITLLRDVQSGQAQTWRCQRDLL